MKFDYYILNSYVRELDGEGPELYAKWIEQVELAEELGYSCAWITEHHFDDYGGMLPSPQLLIASLAQRTSHIRLGTSVSLLPMHQPVRIAEDMAVLDVLTNGRIEVGVGSGMAQTRYGVFGIDPADVRARLEEGVDVLVRAWTHEQFLWDGRFVHCPTPVTVRPRPVHPPLSWPRCACLPKKWRPSSPPRRSRLSRCSRSRTCRARPALSAPDAGSSDPPAD
ncbi:MAG: LLM class flavin-dependent oxidoreductase [Chloroflexota bacterium]